MPVVMLPVDQIEFVKELYPRLKIDDAAIERYRAALDRLPPIVVARERVLTDGYHRWQAYRREKRAEIPCEDLGNLADIEIIRESLRRNATHGQQLSAEDKARHAADWYRRLDGKPADRYVEIAELLSIAVETAEIFCRKARQDEKAEQQATAWRLWLWCMNPEMIADELGLKRRTVADWIGEKRKDTLFARPPRATDKNPWGRIQHFDIWDIGDVDDDAGLPSFFGRMPPQVVENLLWLFTEPGHIVVDPFAGGGTTIDVAMRMGRRVWASDLTPANDLLPIHAHDITTGWPEKAPARADLILLDPPYWQQAAGRYSDDPADLGNMALAPFMDAWHEVLAACAPHLSESGRLAFIISPTETGDGVIDHAFEMTLAARDHGLHAVRRIIVPYQTQQATGQQVTWAREGKHLLKRYRDLVICMR